MKLKKLIYSLFFKKKKRRYSGTGKSRSNSSTTKQKGSQVGNLNKYNLTTLKQQVSETEYISNLRLGRSWILPQMLSMGFRNNKKKNKINKEFCLNDFNDAFSSRYNSSAEGRRNIWNLIARNYSEISKSEGSSKRAKWWTPKVVEDIMEWDFLQCGRATRGFEGRQICKNILHSIPEISNPNDISNAINLYNQNRMRKRHVLYCFSVPDSFIDAFKGDGAYNAMITMVKIYGIYFKDDNGILLNREQCIDIINQRAENLTGQQLLDFCKEKFFDSKAFDYKKFLKN